MKASHRLMHTQATSAPEKKSIMQAPTKRGSRSVSNEGGMAEAVLLCCKTGGGGKQRCRRQHSLVLGAAERQIFTVVCDNGGGGPVVSRVLSDLYQSSVSL